MTRANETAPATTTKSPAEIAMERINARLGGVSYNPARNEPVTLPALNTVRPPAPSVTAPVAPIAPARVKVGKLEPEHRLEWLGAAYAQKGNSARYNEWMARQTGPFTCQQALDAGIPGHHLRWVVGNGWAVRV